MFNVNNKLKLLECVEVKHEKEMEEGVKEQEMDTFWKLLVWLVLHWLCHRQAVIEEIIRTVAYTLMTGREAKYYIFGSSS